LETLHLKALISKKMEKLKNIFFVNLNIHSKNRKIIKTNVNQKN
jgi:hypothetical protein